MKNKLWTLFIISSILIDFIASWIIYKTLRGVYSQHQKTEYTIFMQLIDSLKIKLDTIPIVFYIALGIAIGIVFVFGWAWVDEDLFKR